MGGLDHPVFRRESVKLLIEVKDNTSVIARAMRFWDFFF